MMTAYLLNLCRGISDREAIEKYWSQVGTTYTGKGKVLAAYTPFEILEGDDVPVWGVVAFEWPTMEDAREWYFGEGYQAVKKFREGAQDNICILVEGGWVPAEERKPPADYKG
ncbi:MAG: hypothetical protein JWR80_7630 [Bradyrhizobium sp.]|nr:hypothetical protein [Bradyrhizobium sp.]